MRKQLVRPKRFAPSLRHYMWWRRRSVTCATLRLRALDILRTVDVDPRRGHARDGATCWRATASRRGSRRAASAQRGPRSRACAAPRSPTGRSVALVSDAGTPGDQRSGRATRARRRAGRLSRRADSRRKRADSGNFSGRPRRRMLRVHRFPADAGQSARVRVLATYAALPAALVFYEAPHRVAGTLRDLATARSTGAEGPHRRAS